MRHNLWERVALGAQASRLLRARATPLAHLTRNALDLQQIPSHALFASLALAQQARRLRSQVVEIYGNYRGKCIVVAGEELFVGDTVQEAVALAKAAHPEDKGSITRYIPENEIKFAFPATHALFQEKHPFLQPLIPCPNHFASCRQTDIGWSKAHRR